MIKYYKHIAIIGLCLTLFCSCGIQTRITNHYDLEKVNTLKQEIETIIEATSLTPLFVKIDTDGKYILVTADSGEATHILLESSECKKVEAVAKTLKTYKREMLKKEKKIKTLIKQIQTLRQELKS